MATTLAYSPDLTDDELVQLFQARGGRDDRPFRELFRRYQAVVWRACYGMMRNADDAEDLTQEVFFKAYRNLNKFEGRSSFKTWIYRIAINTAQNEIRRRKRRAQEAETAVEEMAEYLPSDTFLESALEEKQQRRLLQEALADVRPEEYEVLYLKDIEDRPYAEIAEILGISLSAAKMRVQRARLALRVSYRQIAGEV
ncbi:MAG: sigma-70 family RNA polymerase sigma factor [Anaerolineales bacterium]|nr:sigma-70 family RNA polymerase sigma factor [Anaerolineales bacterium]MCB9434521.1 sigma-70 family RNA polymerase sigma factor [Ardenticatenaceae bacterium]